MIRFAPTTKRALSAPLAALMLAMGLAAPMVELADLSAGPGIESEHHAGSCPRAHDHTVCTQLRATHAAPARDGIDRPSASLQRFPAVDYLVDGRAVRRARGRSARAPPRT